MKFIFKSVICFLSVLTFNQNCAQANSAFEGMFEKQTLQRLTQIHQTKLNPEDFKNKVEHLKGQGFTEKRAREIYAQEQIAKFFGKQYSGLLPAGKILTQLKGTYTEELNKGEGVLDEIFTVLDTEALEKDDTPIIYNETHYVNDHTIIQPVDFKKLGENYKFTPSYSIWSGLTVTLERACGVVTVSLPLLKCKPLIGIYLRGNLKQRIDAYHLDHTLTTLEGSGVLTLFKVERAS